MNFHNAFFHMLPFCKHLYIYKNVFESFLSAVGKQFVSLSFDKEYTLTHLYGLKTQVLTYILYLCNYIPFSIRLSKT